MLKKKSCARLLLRAGLPVLGLTVMQSAYALKILGLQIGKAKEATTSVQVDKAKPDQFDVAATKAQQAAAIVQRRVAQSKASTTSKSASTKKSTSPAANALTLPAGAGADLPDFMNGIIPPIDVGAGSGDATVIGGDFFKGLVTHHLNNNFSYKGRSLNELVGVTTNLSTIQGALYTGAIAYFAEHPAFGGNPERGFHPVIWPSLVRTAMENRLVMLPSGELLWPSDPNFQYAIIGNEVPVEAQAQAGVADGYLLLRNEAHIFMTDVDGNILGPNFLPISARAVQNSSGRSRMVSNKRREMEIYSKGWLDLANLETLMLAPIAELAPSIQAAQTQDAVHLLEEDTKLSSCISLILKLKFSQARECFSLRKDQAMYQELAGLDDYNTLQDFAIAAGRGATAGGLITLLLNNGMAASTGIHIGALVNSMSFVYNRYFKKEVITPAQIHSLLTFIDRYTYQPSDTGEIMPKDTGIWQVYSNGVINRYVKKAVIDETGAAVIDDIPIDLYGDDRAANLTLKISTDDASKVTVMGLANTAAQTARAERFQHTLQELGTAATRTLRVAAPANEPALMFKPKARTTPTSAGATTAAKKVAAPAATVPAPASLPPTTEPPAKTTPAGLPIPPMPAGTDGVPGATTRPSEILPPVESDAGVPGTSAPSTTPK